MWHLVASCAGGAVGVVVVVVVGVLVGLQQTPELVDVPPENSWHVPDLVSVLKQEDLHV